MVSMFPQYRDKSIQTTGDSHSLEFSLVLGISHLAILDNSSPAAIAVSRSGPANLVGKLGLKIAGEQDKSIVLVVCCCVYLLPATHDESIVRSDDNEIVDTLGFQLRDLVSVARDVSCRAGGRESTCKEG